MKRALQGLRRYQEAPRPESPPPMPAVAEAGGARLRDYGGSGPAVVFVPSLINPPNILDLLPSPEPHGGAEDGRSSPGEAHSDRKTGDHFSGMRSGESRSLLRWLATRGRRVLLLDWGWPDNDRKTLSVGDHVEHLLLPLTESLGEPVDLVGYCLGGTMAAAAAQLGPARSLVTIAAPWHFSGFPEEARARLARLWAESRPTVGALGLLPMEVLQSAFWSLDPARTIAKFESFADLEGEEARTFVTLEDWANDGPPVSGAAARELFEDLFAEDQAGAGRWRVAGKAIIPETLAIPVLNVVSTTDRIVPAATAIRAGERIELGLGHVGMVVGSRAREKLWAPLADWLSRTAAR